MEQEKSERIRLMHRVADDGGLQAAVLDAWQRTRIDWSFARDGMRGFLRKRAGLGPAERAVVSELVYGLIRHLRRLDAALSAAGVAVGGAAAPPDRQRVMAYLVVEAGFDLDQARRRWPEVDWALVRDIDTRLARERDPVRRLALTCSLPDWLAAALRTDHGDRAEALGRALCGRAPAMLRANTLATSRDDLARWLAEAGIQTRPARYADAGLRVEAQGRGSLFATPAFKQGAFEVQDEGSQLVTALVAPPARAVVVDYCAGAGGKSLGLAALLGNRGRVMACDVDARKLVELRRRARRAGANNLQTVALARDGSWPQALTRLEGTATRVLVDAPCSGLGTLRRHPELRWRLTPDQVAAYPAQQLALCERALSLLGPGGALIYATCTLLRAENQGVIDTLCERHPDLERVPVKTWAAAQWGEADLDRLTGEHGRYLEVDPAGPVNRAGAGQEAVTEHDMDGFFAAILRRPAAGAKS
ncbi:RsmB/NOP family class I SAM-dependent RNA methyltransferase [Haliangium sp.]|uniref:RsmB/NOP family class I SAM-dependent RNA methyltransferase n=1 Tax=Haliangium sp. TaxID=2663208 RepID=UPI003D0E920F